MKKLLMIVMILMTISFNANAGFLMGYAIGHGSCSCNNEKNQIEELNEENKKLKEEINKLINMLEKQNEEKEAETNKKD
jgi:hypothetical protein